jgi:DNA-binding transcriptional LysR family regulator
MNIRQLQFFITVATHLNFTEAAKHLFVTQQTVSQQIADLERDIGVKLFVRDKRTVNLTPAGQVLLKGASSLIEKTDELLEQTRKAATGVTGSLKIGFIASAVKDFLPQTVTTFRRRYPDIDLDLKQFTMGPLHEALEHGALDIGFTMSFDLQNTSGLAWKTLYHDVLSVVIHKDHELASKPNLNFASLASQPFILLSREQSPRFMDLVNRICIKRNLIPNITSTPNLMETVLMLVENGLGVSIVPRHAKNYVFPNLRFYDIDGDDACIQVVVVWSKTSANSSITLFTNELGIN